MLEAFRRKVIAHEQASRANESRNQFSLREKLNVALPLVVIVITLFTASFKYTGYRSRLQKAEEQRMTSDHSKDDFGGLEQYLRGTEHKSTDNEDLDESNKKW